MKKIRFKIYTCIFVSDDVEYFEAAQKMSELDLQTCEWDFS